MRLHNQSLYGNHWAVPADDINEGDYMFSRLVVEAVDEVDDHGFTKIFFKLRDGSAITAKRNELFPVQFPANGDGAMPDASKLYREWTRDDAIPEGTKLVKVEYKIPMGAESKWPARHFPPRAGHRSGISRRLPQTRTSGPLRGSSAKNMDNLHAYLDF